MRRKDINSNSHSQNLISWFLYSAIVAIALIYSWYFFVHVNNNENILTAKSFRVLAQTGENIIQKESGLPIYGEEVSIMEGNHNTTLISGFIQAITAFSETMIQQEFNESRKLATDYEYLKTIIDLDFRFFQLLVCDFETVRVLLVLRDEASERLKKQLYLLATVLHSKFGNEFLSFSGSVQHIKDQFQGFLYQFLFLHFNREFEITPNKIYYNSIFESEELTILERRLINVIKSMTKINKNFALKQAIGLIEEKNEDLILEAFITLIQRKIIISPYFPKLKLKK